MLNQVTFKVTLTIRKVYDIPFAHGKYWCKIKQRRPKLLEIPKYYLLSEKLTETKSREKIMKNHACHFNQAFSFELPIDLDENNELKNCYLRISVKGRSKKSSVRRAGSKGSGLNIRRNSVSMNESSRSSHSMIHTNIGTNNLTLSPKGGRWCQKLRNLSVGLRYLSFFWRF